MKVVLLIFPQLLTNPVPLTPLGNIRVQPPPAVKITLQHSMVKCLRCQAGDVLSESVTERGQDALEPRDVVYWLISEARS